MSNNYNINLNNEDIEIIMDAAIVGWKEIYGNPANNKSLVDYIAELLLEKLDKNEPIEAGTHTKITYDENGLVVAGEELTKEDLPELILEDIKDVTATADEVNILDGALVSTVELNTLEGIKSNVQDQLDSKQPKLTFSPEDTVNKSFDLTEADNIKYPTTKAVVNALKDKQDKLTDEELEALHSGITKDLLEQLKNKQDKLTDEELSVLHSGASKEVIDSIIADKLDKNEPIPSATHTKITYDEDGLVIDGSDLEASDIPMIPVSRLIGVTVSNHDLNKLTDLTVTSDDINELEGIEVNVQDKFNEIDEILEDKASKPYVQTYVRNNAGYYLTKDKQDNAFSNFEELHKTSVFYWNRKQKEPTTNDYVVVLVDETNDNSSMVYGYIRDEIYNEGHWIPRYKLSGEASMWGKIKGYLLDQKDLIAKFEDTLIYAENYTDEKVGDAVDELNKELAKKQPTISDLSTIRDGASKGATALQKVPDEYAKKSDIPTKISSFNNDSNYQTYAQVAALIAGISHFKMEFVTKLPEVGEKMTLYMLPKTGTAGDVYDEYLWIEETKKYEIVGTTAVDLTNYYTKPETGALLNKKQDNLALGDGLDWDEDGKLINTRTSATWENITGNVEDNEQLVEYVKENGSPYFKIVDGCLCIEFEETGE